jgi:hypothetical protein
MSVRATVLTAVLLLIDFIGQAQPAQTDRKLPQLLDGDTPIALTLEAPLKELFEKGAEDENFTVAGTLRYKDPSSAADVELRGLEVSVRGHTSRRETECTFPKLKLKLKGAGSIKIGTHCGEGQDADLTTKYGRLANEKSPHREALVYRLLSIAGAPTLRTRPARITYRDAAQGTPLERNALLLEDDDDAMKRVKGTAEIPMESFGNVVTRKADAEAARIAFAEAMIGNFDWCLKFSPDDIYRCNEPKPLWNVVAFDVGDRASLLMKDFDLAGMVVGPHKWFDTVWNRAFVPSKSEIAIETLSQVQRTRALFPRARLDAERRHFIERKNALYDAVQRAPVDNDGRTLARGYLDNFYRAIENDGEFYRPVVAGTDVQVFLDAQGTKEACGPKDVMRAGTPVNEVQKSGSMTQVVILDAMWRWASKDECNAVQDGPVWIRSDAITRDYPSK